MKSISISIAGSTYHTVLCAEALLQDDRFSISWILTPEPKPIGRKQLITKNPLHEWAETNNIPVILVNKKINTDVKKQIESITTQSNSHLTPNPKTLNPNFLLVVDFGYLIPEWLLQLPSIAPINIHPSELPKYRGSSPGQFALLFGEQKSAVSVIIMNEKLDEGDLIYQENFDVPNTMSLSEYYQHSFSLITKSLPQILYDFATQNITAKPQPLTSPTPVARRLTREDGYIEWELLQTLFPSTASPKELPIRFTDNQLLFSAYQHHGSWPQTIYHAIQAFTPWPGVWTIVSTKDGEKRMKILKISPFMERTPSDSVARVALQLEKVQLEGRTVTTFEEIKNQILP